METAVVKHVPTDIMGENVSRNATVITIHNSVIMCADAYKSHIQRTTSQPTTQMKHPRILSKPVFLLLTQALIVQVCSLYLNDDNDDSEQKFDKINTDVVLSYSAETCSTDTSSDSTCWDERKLLLLQICSLSRMKGDVRLYYFRNLL